MASVLEHQPPELINRLITGVVHLIVFAHGRPERVRLERSWWALHSLKLGAEAALADTFRRRTSPTRFADAFRRACFRRSARAAKADARGLRA